MCELFWPNLLAVLKFKFVSINSIYVQAFLGPCCVQLVSQI